MIGAVGGRPPFMGCYPNTADRVEIHDIHEAALVMAWFAYQAAMADQKIPRARVE